MKTCIWRPCFSCSTLRLRVISDSRSSCRTLICSSYLLIEAAERICDEKNWGSDFRDEANLIRRSPSRRPGRRCGWSRCPGCPSSSRRSWWSSSSASRRRSPPPSPELRPRSRDGLTSRHCYDSATKVAFDVFYYFAWLYLMSVSIYLIMRRATCWSVRIICLSESLL